MPEGIKCSKCNGEGWLEPIGPHSDGSYVTSRPCRRCRQTGWEVMPSPDVCEECYANYADPPSKYCLGCEAYREHTGGS